MSLLTLKARAESAYTSLGITSYGEVPDLGMLEQLANVETPYYGFAQLTEQAEGRTHRRFEVRMDVLDTFFNSEKVETARYRRDYWIEKREELRGLFYAWLGEFYDPDLMEIPEETIVGEFAPFSTRFKFTAVTYTFDVLMKNDYCLDGASPPSASGGTWVLRDTDGTELDTGTVPFGGTAQVEAPDAAATVANTEGTEVASGSVPSGGSLDLTAPDGTTDVQNTLGNTVATGTPPSGGTDTVTAPDASYTVEDQDGTELATGSIPSGDSETVTVTVPRDLFLIVNVSSGDDTAVLDIGTNQAGDLDTLDAGGLTSVTYDLNGSPVTLPFTVADGDTLTVEFDAAGSDTSFTLSGTY